MSSLTKCNHRVTILLPKRWQRLPVRVLDHRDLDGKVEMVVPQIAIVLNAAINRIPSCTVGDAASANEFGRRENRRVAVGVGARERPKKRIVLADNRLRWRFCAIRTTVARIVDNERTAVKVSGEQKLVRAEPIHHGTGFDRTTVASVDTIDDIVGKSAIQIDKRRRGARVESKAVGIERQDEKNLC